MKKTILYISAAMVALLALSGCRKQPAEPTLAERLCGEWRGHELSVDASIYIGFGSDGTFELYQKMETDRYELRRGTYTVTDDILSGCYNDSEPLTYSYRIAVEEDILTMTAQTEGAETNVYRRMNIPEAVREECETVVRSGIL